MHDPDDPYEDPDDDSGEERDDTELYEYRQDDCLNCGQCSWCIERSITAAEEGERGEKET